MLIKNDISPSFDVLQQIVFRNYQKSFQILAEYSDFFEIFKNKMYDNTNKPRRLFLKCP